MPTKPRKGEGERFFECRYYDSCLDRAALENWRAFNCESCDLYRAIFRGLGKAMIETPENKENTRICETCGERPTISPRHRFCPSCMAKMVKHRIIPNRSQNKPPLKESGHKESSVLTINFHPKYVSLLKQIQDLADGEIRSVESQVIFMLKSYLDGKVFAKT
jgi:hypothetical protein